ncbi:MAG: hypothetical protein AAB405_01420 [Patescibacteria group bacterium]
MFQVGLFKLLPKKLEEYKEEIENNQSLSAQAIQTNSIQINEDFGKFFSVVPEMLFKGIQNLMGFRNALVIKHSQNEENLVN